MRAFVGVPLGLQHVEALQRAGETLRENDPSWRDTKWVPAENLHITIEFLGDVPPESVAVLVDDLSSRLAQHDAAHVSFGSLQARPRLQRARMVWAEYADRGGRLGEIARSVSAAASSLGIATEERPFVAHATLVRARRPQPLSPEAISSATVSAQSALGEDAVMSVGHAILYKSTLTQAGAVYDTLAEIPIGQPR
jgi:2'-5' RNA ligase